MDPLFLAVIRFRQRQFDDCIAICGEILRKNPLDQAVWSLKTQALTEQVRVDFLEIFDEGIAESVFTEDTIATAARPEGRPSRHRVLHKDGNPSSQRSLTLSATYRIHTSSYKRLSQIIPNTLTPNNYSLSLRNISTRCSK
jgi:hypothetical protein